MERTLHPDLQRYVNERVLPAMAAIRSLTTTRISSFPSSKLLLRQYR